MDLGFSEAQEAFREELQAFMAAECDRRLVRDLEESDLGYSPDMWRAMAGRGWLGLIFPEALRRRRALLDRPRRPHGGNRTPTLPRPLPDGRPAKRPRPS